MCALPLSVTGVVVVGGHAVSSSNPVFMISGLDKQVFDHGTLVLRPVCP